MGACLHVEASGQCCLCSSIAVYIVIKFGFEHVCVCRCTHLWTCMLEINVGYLIFLDHSLLHFLRQGLSLELTDATKLDGQWAEAVACPGSVFCLCLPRVEVIDAHFLWPFSFLYFIFKMGAGNYTQVLMFVWQTCYQPTSHLPSSMCNI